MHYIIKHIRSVYPTPPHYIIPKTHVRVSGMLELLLGSKGLELLIHHSAKRRGAAIASE